MRSTLTLFFNRQTVLLGAALLFMNAAAVAQAPAWQWGLQSTNPTPTDGTGNDGNAVATDAAGRVYVGGSYGEAYISSVVATATRNFGSAGTVGPGRGGFVAQATAAGQWAWVRAVVPVGTPPGAVVATASITGIAVGANGNVYAAGHARALSLQAGNITQTVGGGGDCVFVACFDNTGVCQWLQVAEGVSGLPVPVADASTGGVAICGNYRGSPRIGTTPLPATTPSVEGIFVARLNAAGQWAGAAGATGTASLGGPANLAAGPNGEIAVLTNFSGGNAVFGPHVATATSNPNGVALVAQLSPANQWQWAASGGGSGWSVVFGGAYSPAGTLWVGGLGANGATLGTATLAGATGAPGSRENSFWGQVSGGTWSNVQQLPLVVGVDSGFRLLKTDDARNLLLFGRAINSLGTPAQVVVGNQTLAVPANGSVLFIAQILPSSGQLRYVAPVLNSAQVQNARLRLFDAAFDATGNLYFTGGFSGNATFGNSVLSGTPYSTTSNTGSDVFLTKLPNALAPLAARPAALAPALSIFPNPAHGRATLRLPALAEAAATAVLLDALGREVRRYAVPARATAVPIELAGLAPGLYLVRCGAAVGRLVVE